MKPFEYLIVLNSIVIGLAITNLMAGFARLMHSRGNVRPYWPSLIWASVLFIGCVQHWWTGYSSRGVVHWTFAGFMAMLATPLDLYLLSELVLPRRLDIGDGADAMRDWYARNRNWFFPLSALLAPLSYIEEYAVKGNIGKKPVEDVMLALLVVLAICGLRARTERAIHAVAACGLVFVLLYIVLLFMSLPT